MTRQCPFQTIEYRQEGVCLLPQFILQTMDINPVESVTSLSGESEST